MKSLNDIRQSVVKEFPEIHGPYLFLKEMDLGAQAIGLGYHKSKKHGFTKVLFDCAIETNYTELLPDWVEDWFLERVRKAHER